MDLKKQLEALDKELKEIERKNLMSNTFNGAGYIAVSLNKKLAESLNLKKDAYYGYIFWERSSNGSFEEMLKGVREVIKIWREKYLGEIGISDVILNYKLN